MNYKIIGPSYKFVRNDILVKFIEIFKINNSEYILDKNILKNIIDKYITISNSLVNYGSWEIYKKQGIDLNLKKNIMLEVVIRLTEKFNKN